MAGKQVNELDVLPSFTDTSLLPVHNGTGLKKGLLSQLANYLGNKFSNPNLLINSDFKINQRGATSYESRGYSVDRWKIWNCTVIPNKNGGITIKNDKYTATGTLVQYLGTATVGSSTLSCYVESVTGSVTMFSDDNTQIALKKGLNVLHTNNSTKGFSLYIAVGATVVLKWAKLENGSVATQYVHPIYSEEYVKCQWYDRYISGSRSGYISNGIIYINIPEIQSMRLNIPSIQQADFEGFVYYGNGEAITVAKSDIVNVTVDAYKELVLTPKTTLMNDIKAKGVTTIEYVFNPNKGVHLDAEIYDNEQEK